MTDKAKKYYEKIKQKNLQRKRLPRGQYQKTKGELSDGIKQDSN